jgi:hypothetical protein
MKPYGCQKLYVIYIYIYIYITANLSNPFYVTIKSRLTLVQIKIWMKKYYLAHLKSICLNLGFLIVKRLSPIFKLIAYYIDITHRFFFTKYFTFSVFSSHYMVFFKIIFWWQQFFLSNLDFLYFLWLIF